MTPCVLLLRAPWLESDGFLLTLAPDFLEIRAKRIQVVVEPLQQFFARRAGLFDDWIFPHDYSSMSSSGVHMTGGS
jgi:hypothetical protein